MSWRNSKAFERLQFRMLSVIGIGTVLSLGLLILLKKEGEFGVLRLQALPAVLAVDSRTCAGLLSQYHWS